MIDRRFFSDHFHKAQPLPDDLRAERGELFIPQRERFAQLIVALQIFQERVALLEQAVILLQCERVAHFFTADRAVDKIAAFGRSPFDKTEIFGRKHHGAKALDQRGGGFLFHAVELDDAPVRFDRDTRRLAALLSEKPAIELSERLVKLDQLPVTLRPERMTAAEQPQRLDDIRLALRVLAVDDIHTLAGADIAVREVAVVLKS